MLAINSCAKNAMVNSGPLLKATYSTSVDAAEELVQITPFATFIKELKIFLTLLLVNRSHGITGEERESTQFLLSSNLTRSNACI
jgi:hypothetical protein